MRGNVKIDCCAAWAVGNLLPQIAAQNLNRDPSERLTPNAVAKYVCDMAQAMFNEFEAREWIEVQAPAPGTQAWERAASLPK